MLVLACVLSAQTLPEFGANLHFGERDRICGNPGTYRSSLVSRVSDAIRMAGFQTAVQAQPTLGFADCSRLRGFAF